MNIWKTPGCHSLKMLIAWFEQFAHLNTEFFSSFWGEEGWIPLNYKIRKIIIGNVFLFFKKIRTEIVHKHEMNFLLVYGKWSSTLINIQWNLIYFLKLKSRNRRRAVYCLKWEKKSSMFVTALSLTVNCRYSEKMLMSLIEDKN